MDLTVVLVLPQYAPVIGGVEKHVERQATGLTKLGVAVEVLTTDLSGELPPVETRDGIVVRRFPRVPRSAVYFFSPQLGRWLNTNAERFSIIHAHNYGTLLTLQSARISRQKNIPFVVTPHYHGTGHSPLRKLLHFPYRLAGNWIMHSAKQVMCVSDAERRLIERDFGQNIPTILAPNGIGVDADALQSADPFPKKPGEVCLLVATRLEHYKRVDRLITALPQLPSAYRVVIIGDGPDKSSIEQLAQQLKVDNRIQMLGHVSQADLLSWYRTADVFVSLSTQEAFGMTVLEAAVAGAHVVASDIPAHMEVAHYLPENHVWFVSEQTTASALAELIVKAAETPLTSEPGDWHVPTWEGLVAKTLECYHSISTAH